MEPLLTSSYYFKIEDLLPYCLLFLFLLIVVITVSNSIMRLKGMFAVVLTFSCIRYGIGYDYMSYKDFIMGVGDEFALMAMEPIPKLLMEISRVTHYQLFFIVTSFLIYIPLYYFLKRFSYSPGLSFWIYLCVPIFFMESLSVLRNHVAFSFFLLSYLFFAERKYVHTVIFYLVAIGFHYSTLVALPIFILHNFTLKREYAIGIIVCSLFGSAILTSVLFSLSSDIYLVSKFLSYAERSRGGGDFMAIVINMFGVLVLVKWNQLRDLNDNNARFLTFICIGVAIWNMFSFDYTLRLRLSTFYLLFSLLIIPEFSKVFDFEERQFKHCAAMICFSLYMLLFAVNIKSNLDTHEKLSMLPYKVFFLND